MAAWMAAIMVIREFAVTGLRMVALEAGDGDGHLAVGLDRSDAGVSRHAGGGRAEKASAHRADAPDAVHRVEHRAPEPPLRLNPGDVHRHIGDGVRHARAEGAEQHGPVEQPIPVPLHQAGLFATVIDLRARMERIDRVLFGARSVAHAPVADLEARRAPDLLAALHDPRRHALVERVGVDLEEAVLVLLEEEGERVGGDQHQQAQGEQLAVRRRPRVGRAGQADVLDVQHPDVLRRLRPRSGLGGGVV